MKEHIPDLEQDHLTRRFAIGASFKRFNAKYDIFNRAIWDDKVDPKAFFKSYDTMDQVPRKAKGFDQWDYALRNASWHLTDHIGERKFDQTGQVEGFTHPFTTETKSTSQQIVVDDPNEATHRIKAAAKLLGAGATGIAALDRRWIYSHVYNRKEQRRESWDLPKHFQSVIVLIIPMDYQLGRTFPSALSGSTTGIGYAHSLQCAIMLVQLIVNLGYDAMASMNDSGLNIPLAIQAGLGEYGRHGLLISRDFGPNVRIAKVFTDLPLSHDKPRDFGVKSFCNICRKCADACPPRAIPKGEPQSEPPNISSHSHVTKWTVNAEKCFGFWVGMNSDCAICIRVCPYNKDYTKWWNRLGKWLAGGPLRHLMLWLDHQLKFGLRMPPGQWWNRSLGKTNGSE